MGEVSKDLIREREKQIEGLKQLFKTLFGEYFKKHNEYPPLYTGDLVKDASRVDQFIGSRPDILRSIQSLNAVQDMVVKTALDVLKDLTQKEK